MEAALLDRGLVVMDGGTLRISGKNYGASWARLRSTANAGTDILELNAAANATWATGQEVVVASSDYDSSRTDLGTIQTFDALNDDVDLQANLQWTHFSDEQDFDPTGGSAAEWKVEERAEVGLLSRRVAIEGTPVAIPLSNPVLTANGHVFFYRSSASEPPPVIDVHWAEFRTLGIDGGLMRYPVHFHGIGDPGAGALLQIRNSSVHGSLLHGIVVHASEGVTIEDNVVYDVLGHGIYLEEDGMMGPTEGNFIRDNLALKNGLPNVEPSAPPDEHEPANFYVRNPRNVITGNVAAGSAASGFYLKLQRDETPIDYAGMTFSGNQAHSCGTIGIYQNDEIRPLAEMTLADCFVWKVRRNGVWFRCVGDLLVSDLIAADCRNGIYPATLGLRDAGEGHHRIENGLFVGETGNHGAPDPSKPWETNVGRSLPQAHEYELTNHQLQWSVLSGVEAYDGFVEVDDCRFAEFTDLNLDGTGPYFYGWRKAAGLTQVAKTSTWSNDPRNVVRGCAFGTNVSRTAYLRDPLPGDNQIAFTFIVDEDDRLGYGADVMLFPNVDFLGLDQPLAVFHPDALPPATGLNGYVVPARNASAPTNGLSYGQLTFWPHYPTGVGLDPTPDDMATMSFTQVFDPSGAAPVLGEPWVCNSVPEGMDVGGSGEWTFPLSLEVGDDTAAADVKYYRVEYPAGHVTETPKNLDVWLRFTPRNGEIVFLEIPYDGGSGSGGRPGTVNYRNEFLQLVTIDEFVPTSSTLPPFEEFLTEAPPQSYWHVPISPTEKILMLKITSIALQGLAAFPEGTQIEFRIRQ